MEKRGKEKRRLYISSSHEFNIPQVEAELNQDENCASIKI
jgi:hypothetical protein